MLNLVTLFEVYAVFFYQIQIKLRTQTSTNVIRKIDSNTISKMAW